MDVGAQNRYGVTDLDAIGNGWQLVNFTEMPDFQGLSTEVIGAEVQVAVRAGVVDTVLAEVRRRRIGTESNVPCERYCRTTILETVMLAAITGD